MRSRQVSVVALVAVAGFLATSLGAGASDTPSVAVQVPSSGVANFPPELPKFLSPAEAAVANAVTVPESRPAEAPKVDVTTPAPAPQSAEPAKPLIATPAAPADAAKSSPQTAEAPAAAKPALTLASEIAERLKRERGASAGDREDREAIVKVYAGRNGEPIWVDEKGLTAKALTVMNEIGAADSYGLDPAQFKLPVLAPGAGGSRDDLADTEVSLSLAALKYARHARGGRLDPQSLSKNFDRSPPIYAPDTVLAELASADKPGNYLRELNPRHAQFEKLRLKYLAIKSGQYVIDPPAPVAQPAAQPVKSAKKQGTVPQPKAMTREKLEQKLLANMEMWRWMPDNLGDYYIHNNIPEFMTRMYRSGKLVHAERIVVGKPENQTPIFSDAMELVVFKPFWNVPESIKWKELQPQLSRNPEALSRAGLRASYNGKPVDPATVDWSTADMRALHIFQPPGTANALGQVKFLFPNKHDVYMHDTPTKHLFNNPSRAYSHGCMRVRDPLRFAELLLSHDKGWDMQRVRQLANGGPENNEIRLVTKVPVHVTYFTAWVDDDGSLKTFNDIYSHESKIKLGLEGKAHLIAQPRQERFQPVARGQVRFVEKGWGGGGGSSTPFEKWVKDVFNF